MTILTSGRLSVPPFLLRTSLALDQILEIVKSGDGVVSNDGGWGNIFDPDDLVGERGRRSLQVGVPEIVPEDAISPRRLRSRFYWWSFDRVASRVLGASANADKVQRLSAADIIVEQIDDQQYLCLATTRNEYKVMAARVLQEIREYDGGASVSDASTPFTPLPDDFFLWLMYRFHREPQLTPALRISDMSDISSQDVAFRASRLQGGVALDRAELLALIMGGSSQFGPAGVVLDDASLSLSVAVVIHVDGGATFKMAQTDYYGRPRGESATREDKGLNIVDQFYNKVLPEALSAYHESASSWPSQREGYVHQARDEMTRILQAILH